MAVEEIKESENLKPNCPHHCPPNCTPYIPYVNKINVTKKEVECNWDKEKTIEIQGYVKVFAKKFTHSEIDCIDDIRCEKDKDCNHRHKKLGKGDDFGFSLIFGNYGEFSYKGKNKCATVEDTLIVPQHVYLKVMSLDINCDFKLFNKKTGKYIEVCDKLYPGTYHLEVHKHVNNSWIKDFDIPCHSIFNISVLFQIEFQSCPPCKDEKES